MSDPFDRLHRVVDDVDGADLGAPDPGFVRSLRARLDRTLTGDVPVVDHPERTTMTTTPTVTATLVPYLAVRGGAVALDWYTAVFDAVEAMRYTGDDGRIGHAELRVGDATWYLADEYPEIGVVGPASVGGTTVALHLTVSDVDDVFRRAVAAGATALMAPEDQAHGARHGTILDPFGHRWMLSTPIGQPTIEEIEAATDGFTVTGEA